MTVLLYGALSPILFLYPFELIGRRGFSPAAVGLILLPLGLIIGVLAGPAGRAADRIGPRPLLVWGAALVTVSDLAFAAAPLGLPGAILPIVLLAVSMALVVAPLTTAVMNAAPDALAGAASGFNNAASRPAGLLAVAMSGAIAATVFSTPAYVALFEAFPPENAPEAEAVAAAFDRAYLAAMLAASTLARAATVVARLAPPGRHG